MAEYRETQVAPPPLIVPSPGKLCDLNASIDNGLFMDTTSWQNAQIKMLLPSPSPSPSDGILLHLSPQNQDTSMVTEQNQPSQPQLRDGFTVPPCTDGSAPPLHSSSCAPSEDMNALSPFAALHTPTTPDMELLLKSIGQTPKDDMDTGLPLPPLPVDPPPILLGADALVKISFKRRATMPSVTLNDDSVMQEDAKESASLQNPPTRSCSLNPGTLNNMQNVDGLADRLESTSLADTFQLRHLSNDSSQPSSIQGIRCITTTLATPDSSIVGGSDADGISNMHGRQLAARAPSSGPLQATAVSHTAGMPPTGTAAMYLPQFLSMSMPNATTALAGLPSSSHTSIAMGAPLGSIVNLSTSSVVGVATPQRSTDLSFNAVATDSISGGGTTSNDTTPSTSMVPAPPVPAHLNAMASLLQKRQRSCRSTLTFDEYDKKYGPSGKCVTGVCFEICSTPCKHHTCTCCKKNRKLLNTPKNKAWCGPCTRREKVDGLEFVKCGHTFNHSGQLCGVEMLPEAFDNHWKQHKKDLAPDSVPISLHVATTEGRMCSACTNMRPVTYFPSQDTNVSCMHCQAVKGKGKKGAAANNNNGTAAVRRSPSPAQPHHAVLSGLGTALPEMALMGLIARSSHSGAGSDGNSSGMAGLDLQQLTSYTTLLRQGVDMELDGSVNRGDVSVDGSTSMTHVNTGAAGASCLVTIPNITQQTTLLQQLEDGMNVLRSLLVSNSHLVRKVLEHQVVGHASPEQAADLSRFVQLGKDLIQDVHQVIEPFAAALTGQVHM